MLSRVLLLSCVVLLACGHPTGPSGGQARAPRDLSGAVSRALQKSGLPALGAAVVTSEGLEAIGTAGVRSWGAAQAVTRDDQWHIGSCTKAMSATLAARLVERGRLRWDTTVGEMFGPGINPAWKDVQLLWLLCHRSGASLNFEQDLWERMVARGGSTRAQRRFFVDEGLKEAPAIAPNTQTLYSNAGYMIAGAMLEAAAGSSWEELMRREVFEPLSMTRTGFGAPGTPGALDEPLGHTRGAGGGWSPVELGPNADNPAASGPAGTIHTSLADWGLFVAAHLRGARGDQSYLQSATWRTLHTPAGPDGEYAPGWAAAEAPWAGGRLLRHLGSNSFWVAEASMAPGKDLAVLIVCNVGDDAAEAPFKELLAELSASHADGGK